MEIVIITCLVFCTAWILWRKRAKIRTAHKAALDRAWRIVLNDPNYMLRRPIEERKHDYEEKAHKEEIKEEGL